jgi:hypothetical protein
MKAFFNSSLGLLLIGFLLTTVFGTLINNFYSKATWEREKKFELLKRSLDRNEKLLEDLSVTMGTRAIRLMRVFWAVETPPTAFKTPEERKQVIAQRWEEYSKAVLDWNEHLRVYISKIIYLAGEETARLFYISEEGSTEKERAGTVYNQFQRAHYAVKELKDMPYEPNAEKWQKSHDLAENSIQQLYKKIDVFLVNLYRALDFHARNDTPIQ